MVAGHADHQHLHLHQVRDSLSHVHVPADKVAAAANINVPEVKKVSLSHVKVPGTVKGHPLHIDEPGTVKGHPLHIDESGIIKGHPIQANVVDTKKGSQSHIRIPLEKLKSLSHVAAPNVVKGSPVQADVPTEKKGSGSHIKVPDTKKVSLSHIKLPDNLVDNKMEFIHKSPAERLGNKASTGEQVVTIDSVVYVTSNGAPQGADLAGTPTQSSGPHHTSESKEQESYAHAKAIANRPHSWTSTESSSAAAATPTHHVVHSPLQTTRSSSAMTTTAISSAAVTSGISTSIQTGSSSPVADSPIAVTSNPSLPLVNNEKNANSGMTGGAKAGLAIGIIIAIALAAGLLFFCWRRRKNQGNSDKQEITDEKHGSFFGSNQKAPSDYRGSVQSDTRSTHTAATAPRLSLRPVTQFLPNIMDSRKSADTSGSMSEKPKSAWERQQSNPFDDDAVLKEKTRPESPPANPFDESDGRKSPSGNSVSSATLEGSEPATPRSTNSGNSATATAGAGAPGPRGPNNVHRVQLDFKPSMDDELELKSGQLVRMLHEYDDGWALCIRMDRSQQGVCPRTCLSKLPVKPRPQGPPPNGGNGRPMAPPGSRGPSPPNAGNMVPRPLTPNGQNRERSQTLTKTSPSPQGSPRNRSQSVADGTAVPSRKPVPGQAL